MGPNKYYQFINTVEVAEFAPTSYHFYGVFEGTMEYGAYIENHGIFALSDRLAELDNETKNDIEKIIKDKVEELKEEEKI